MKPRFVFVFLAVLSVVACAREVSEPLPVSSQESVKEYLSEQMDIFKIQGLLRSAIFRMWRIPDFV